MKTRTIVALLSCIALAFSLYVTPSANASSAEDEVLQVEKNWVKAATTSDRELFYSLYWHSPKTSTYHPTTGSPFLYQGWELLEKTWEPNFTQKLPEGTVTITMHHPQVTMLTDNVAIVTLYETVTENPPLVKEQIIFQTRITRLLQKIDGKWLIVHDHASMLPVD